MGQPSTIRVGLVYAFFAYAAWGLLSPLGKHLLDDFEPLGLNAVRFLFATIIFLVFVGPSGTRASLDTLRHRGVLWVNLLASFSLTLFLYSLTVLDATYATLGFYTAPLWTAGLAAWVLGERVGKWFVPSIAALLLGGYLALFGIAAPRDIAPLGMAFAVASAVVWAFYTVALRKHAPGIPLKPLMGASFIFGTLYFYALAVALEGWPRFVGREAEVWGWMAIYVAGPSLTSFVFFNAALQKAPAGLVNILVGAELGFTVLFSYLILGDTFTTWQMAGLGVVLGAVTAYLWSRRGETKAPAF